MMETFVIFAAVGGFLMGMGFLLGLGAVAFYIWGME